MCTVEDTRVCGKTTKKSRLNTKCRVVVDPGKDCCRGEAPAGFWDTGKKFCLQVGGGAVFTLEVWGLAYLLRMELGLNLSRPVLAPCSRPPHGAASC